MARNEKLWGGPPGPRGSPGTRSVSILVVTLLFSCIPTYAQNNDASKRSKYKLEDPLQNPAFVHFYNNEYDEALQGFQIQAKQRPSEPESYNHLAQTILYRELYLQGALESQLVTGNNPFLRREKKGINPDKKAAFFSNLERATELSKKRLETNPQDLSALYNLAVTYGLRANFNFLVEKAWMDSLHDATAARKVNQQILEIDPEFFDANLILGLNHYVVGSLPFYLKAVGFLGGFRGDRDQGIQELQLVASKGTLSRYDAEILLAVIYRREREPKLAIPLLQHLAQTFPRNYLFRFEQVQMYSDAGDKVAALRVLKEIEDRRQSGAPGYAQIQPERLRFAKGNLLFWYGELDPALADLRAVTLKANQVDLNTAVLAWLRVGQIYDLKGNHELAVEAYRETMRTAPGSDAASEAKDYINSPYHKKKDG
jgi:hypothetical protein